MYALCKLNSISCGNFDNATRHLKLPQPTSTKAIKELRRLWRTERCEVGFLHDESVHDVGKGSDARLEEIKLVVGESGVDNAAEVFSPPQLSSRRASLRWKMFHVEVEKLVNHDRAVIG